MMKRGKKERKKKCLFKEGFLCIPLGCIRAKKKSDDLSCVLYIDVFCLPTFYYYYYYYYFIDTEADDYLNSEDTQVGREAAARLEAGAAHLAVNILTRKRPRTVSGGHSGSYEDRGFLGSPLAQELRRKMGVIT